MGAWGVAIFSDDLAADLRDEFRDLIGEGLTPIQAVDRLTNEHNSSLKDSDELPVFWVSLAATQWKLGRLEARTKREALRVIDSGQDLDRWELPGQRKKRAVVLAKLRQELLLPPPAPKRIARNIKEANKWPVGEVVGLHLLSGNWTLLRVLGHHADQGGRFAAFEILDWVGDLPFPVEAIPKMALTRSRGKYEISQFLLPDPRQKKDIARVVRLGIVSKPAQECGGYAAFSWRNLDRWLNEIFALE